MSSLNQRYRRDNGYHDHEARRDDRRRYSRSRSRSRQRRYRRDDSRTRSRSRGRSPLEYRRRHYGRRSRTRSRSRSLSRHDRYTTSRRYKDSRSRSRSHSRTRTYRSSKRNTRSRSTDKLMQKFQDNKRSQNDNEEVKKLTVPLATTVEKRHDEQEYTGTNIEADMSTDLQNLPLPKREPIGAYYNLDTEEPFDKERIHREMEEKLRLALAREGKVYPPKKPEASHPVFANDGSFLELFKKMQAQQTPAPASTGMMVPSAAAPPIASSSNAAAYITATAAGKSAPPPPIVGRRRGGKILKTGMVAKPKALSEQGDDPKDFWALYLAEVNKYKSHACESDTGNRPLVK